MSKMKIMYRDIGMSTVIILILFVVIAFTYVRYHIEEDWLYVEATELQLSIEPLILNCYDRTFAF
jgi:hypothetical protein